MREAARLPADRTLGCRPTNRPETAPVIGLRIARRSGLTKRCLRLLIEPAQESGDPLRRGRSSASGSPDPIWASFVGFEFLARVPSPDKLVLLSFLAAPFGIRTNESPKVAKKRLSRIFEGSWSSRKPLMLRHAPCRNRTCNPVIKSHRLLCFRMRQMLCPELEGFNAPDAYSSVHSNTYSQSKN
jgi:hypothetical protein